MPFSVAASPPPDSDDNFGLGDDDDDDVSFTLSPEVSVKREDDTFVYVWPQATPSVLSLDFAPIKSESDIDDFDFNDMNNSKRLSTQTVKQERHEELDLDLDALSLSFDEKRSAGPFGLGIGVKSEDGGFISVADVGSSWGQPVDLTQDEPVCDLAVALISDGNSSETNAAFHSDWKDVELLGPDSVRMQEFEDSRWEDVCILQNVTSPSSIRKTRTPLEQHDEDLRAATPQSPNISYRFASLHRSASRDLDQTQMRFMSPSLTFGSPGSLPSSMPTCSDGSPETELDSVGPASPPSFGGPGSPAAVHEKEPITIVSSDEHEIERSAPWVIPGKECPPSAPSRRVVASEFMDIGLSETSAPWERGMVSQEDVEEHLLAPAPIAMMSLGIPSLTKVPFDSVVAPTPEPPLSPQEEAVFQSLCMFPEMGWDTDPQGDVTAAAAQEVAKAIQGTMVTPEVAFADVFAAATRPPSTLRAKRTGKRASIEKEQAHKPECTEKTDEDYNDGDDDGEMDSRRSSHSREKSGSLANANSKGPLRRSKRVANAVATQRNRDRLRKRTASS
ncbi:hypothetical protein EW145_g6036 [Phellinidium pouzarii]|uniref:Uncharacterized protein n=1 Tax=Phellinidium pouzarii TaxID=167371 RepID=A0A4S4KXZ0_9AGAM|nr:hypothetical protein EW145_g6036 [Phellinidium pouzarii]